MTIQTPTATRIITPWISIEVIEDLRYELFEEFSRIAHQCKGHPQHRTPENRARLIDLIRELRRISALIES